MTTFPGDDEEAPGAGPNRVVSLRNRCLESKSPYVRAHAENATAWQLWDPSTLELARRLNRLLFVSIGYSACHWCHVMADESFADPRIAQLLNERFLPIKLDREERPDIDRQYMDFLQATSGGGGWPLNVFVTPDLEPIFGGTYWPGPSSERAKLGGVSFEQILIRVADAWKEQEARCRENGKQIVHQLREFAQEGNLGGRSAEEGASGADDNGELDGLELDLLEESFQYYKARFDGTYGGFGGAPKFPTPVHLRHLLRLESYGQDTRDVVGEEECTQARDMVVKTLECMARGGIKDQIGHGFARYSVARDWSLPHFEKMLYDNAQLLPLYTDAYLLTKSPLFFATAHDIATYLTSAPILSPLGGFHASEDADSLPAAQSKHKREGAFYVWTEEELKTLLSEEEFKIASKYWGIQSTGNIEARYDAQGELKGQNTLAVQYDSISTLAAELEQSDRTVSAALRAAQIQLFSHRSATRPDPALDDKIVTSWNGLAISALARAGSALDTPAYTAAAVSAAKCIETHLFDPSTGTLRRVYREGPGDTPGFADDYAFMISGLLDLYSATFDDSHLRLAEILQRTQLELFWDAGSNSNKSGSGGGFFSTPANQPDILIRAKDGMDSAEPSVNGTSARNLLRLSALLDDPALAVCARQTLAAFEVEIGTHPGLFSGLLEALVMARRGVASVVLVGDGPLVEGFLRRWREAVGAERIAVSRVGGKGTKDEWLRGQNGLLKEINAGREMVQICEGTKCRILSAEEVDALFE